MNGENTMRDALRTIVTMIEHDLPAEMPNEIHARAEWYAILIGQLRATAIAAIEQNDRTHGVLRAALAGALMALASPPSWPHRAATIEHAREILHGSKS